MQVQFWVYGCVVVAVAATLRRFVGFGFAMVSVSGLSLMVAPADAVLVTLILQIALGLKNMRLMRESTRWRILPWLMLAGLISTPVGILITHEVAEPTLRVLIGGCILLALGPLLARRTPAFDASAPLSAVSGLLAGLLNSIAAVPAPPLLIYLMGLRDIDLEQRRATLITIFTLLSVIALAGRLVSGNIVQHAVILGLLLCPVAFAGDYVGRRIPGALNRRLVDGISIGIVIASSLTLVLSAFI